MITVVLTTILSKEYDASSQWGLSFCSMSMASFRQAHGIARLSYIVSPLIKKDYRFMFIARFHYVNCLIMRTFLPPYVVSICFIVRRTQNTNRYSKLLSGYNHYENIGTKVFIFICTVLWCIHIMSVHSSTVCLY